jgi:hypothetical protein
MKKIISLLSIVGYFAILSAQTGNVGINTPTPTNTLTVNGNQSIGTGYTGIAAPTNGAIIEGSTGIGTSTVFEGSLLELNSNNKGLRLPQVFLTNTRAFAPITGTIPPTTPNPSYGLTVYNTNPNIVAGSFEYPAKGMGEYYWDGIGWVSKNSTIGAQNAEAYFILRGNTISGYQIVPKDVWTRMVFAQIAINKFGAFDNTTGTFTVPPKGTGLYQINAIYSTVPNATLSQKGRVGVFVNGFLDRTVAIGKATPGENITAEGSGLVYLLSGSVVDFRY